MPTYEVRQATLDDTAAICALHTAAIPNWQRLTADGRVEDLPYEALTVYERWLHGGAWMSVETGAIHLGHLLLGAGLPLVVLDKDRAVQGYAEAYFGMEPPPFGRHLNLGNLTIHPENGDPRMAYALIDTLFELAADANCERLTVCAVLDDVVYQHYRLQRLVRTQRFSIPARSGQVFYKANTHLDADPKQIEGWYMSVGRVASARQHWENLWPRTWDALPEIRERQTARLQLSAAGQEALVCLQQQLYVPRSLDVYAWSPKMMSGQMLSALRDWAYREQYRTLVLFVDERIEKALGPDAEADGFYRDVFAVDLDR